MTTAGPSLNKPHVCWFSITLLNTCDVKDVRYDKLVALNGRCSVKRQQICLRLGTIQPNMPPGPLEIKEKSHLTDVPPSHCETLSAKTATLSIQHTCRVESCMSLQLQHVCLLA